MPKRKTPKPSCAGCRAAAGAPKSKHDPFCRIVHPSRHDLLQLALKNKEISYGPQSHPDIIC